MGVGFQRRGDLLEGFNLAFSAARIRETARRLGPQLRSMDALEIVHRLDLLDWVRREDFFGYRDTVGIPALHLHILTSVFQAALHDPDNNGLSFDIVDGAVESVLVSETDGRVAVTLTRTRPEPPAAAAGR